MKETLSRRKFTLTKRFVVIYRKNGKQLQKAAVVPYRISLDSTKKVLDRMFSPEYYKENNIKESDKVEIVSIHLARAKVMSKSWQKRRALIWT